MLAFQRVRMHIPGILKFSKYDDLVHLSVFGLCLYVRAGARRKLFGIVWGQN